MPDALADRPRVLAHRAAGGVSNMFTVEGGKPTSARRVAEDVTDRVLRRISPSPHAEATPELAGMAGPAAAGAAGRTSERTQKSTL